MLNAGEVLDRIHGYLLSMGTGALGEFEKRMAPRLGFSPNNSWLSRAVSEKVRDIRLSRFLAVLEELGWSLGDLDSKELFNIRKVSPPPSAQIILDTHGDGVADEFLEDCEATRFHSPSQAISKISALAFELSADQRSKALAIMMCSFQALLDLESAAWCFTHGLREAQTYSAQAELHLRANLLMLELSRPREAKRQVEKALRLFTDDGNLQGAFECLVSKGICLALDGKTNEALRLLKHESEIRPGYEAARLQWLSVLTPESDHLVERALEILKGQQPSSAAKIIWLRGLSEESLELLIEAQSLMPAWNGIDRALISADLAKLLLIKGKKDDAKTACRAAFSESIVIPEAEGHLIDLVKLGSLNNISISSALESLNDIRSSIALCRERHLSQQSKRLGSAVGNDHGTVLGRAETSAVIDC